MNSAASTFLKEPCAVFLLVWVFSRCLLNAWMNEWMNAYLPPSQGPKPAQSGELVWISFYSSFSGEGEEHLIWSLEDPSVHCAWPWPQTAQDRLCAATGVHISWLRHSFPSATLEWGSGCYRASVSLHNMGLTSGLLGVSEGVGKNWRTLKVLCKFKDRGGGTRKKQMISLAWTGKFLWTQVQRRPQAGTLVGLFVSLSSPPQKQGRQRLLTCLRPSLHPHRWNFPPFFFFPNINQGPRQSTVDSLSLEEQDSSPFWETLAASQGPSGPPKLDGLSRGHLHPQCRPRLLPVSSSRCGVLQSQWSCVLEPGTPRPPECLPLPPAGPQSHKRPLCSSEEGWPRKAPMGLSPC